MQAVLDECMDPVAAAKWAAMPEIAGGDLANLCRLVRKPLSKRVRQKEIPLGEAMAEYVRHQPLFIRRNLKRILGSAQIVSTKRVRAMLVDALSPIVEDESSANTVFYVGHFVSSSTLAVLLFLHGVPSESICKRVSIVTSANALSKSLSSKVVVVDDSAYSGSSLVSLIQQLTSVISRRQPVHIVLPVATDEALYRIEAACKKYSTFMTLGMRAVTVFHDMSEVDVLMMDVYIVEDGNSEGSSIKSYLFDVLGLDDRQCLILLQHKVNDLAMVPHRLLHVGPVYPSCDAAFVVPSRHVAEAIIGTALGHSLTSQTQPENDYSRNAKVSDYVKKHWHMLLRNFASAGRCRRKRPTEQVPLLPPPLLQQGYASMLHAFT